MSPPSTLAQQIVGEKHQHGSPTDRVRYVGDTSVLQLLQSKIPFGALDDVSSKGKYRRFGSKIVHIANDEMADGRCNRNTARLFQMPSGINAWIYICTGADKYTSDRLLQIYFLNIHPLLPIINKTEFLRQYRDQANSYPPIILLNTMFGAAARFIAVESMKHQQHDRFVPPDLAWDGAREWANRFFDQAFGYMSSTSCGSSISKVQAIILIHNTNSNISNQEATAWNLNGTAIRLAQAFCLNRSVEDWEIPESDKELRKRIWWALHITDRFQSTALGRPLSIREEDNDVSYPSPYASWKEVLDDPIDENDDSTPRFPSATYRPESTDDEVDIYQFFIQLIKLSEILGRILQGLYTPKAREYSITQGSDAIVRGLDHELTEWRFGFLKAMKTSNFKDFDEQKGYFAPSIASTLMCYSACLILLHRPFIEKQGPYHDVEPRPASLSIRISSSAASRGIYIAERMTVRDFIMFPFAFSIYPIFQFCLIHIYNTRSPDDQVAASGRAELRKSLRVVERLRDLSSLSRLLYDVVRLITESLQTNIDLNTPNTNITATEEQQPGNDPAYSTELIQTTLPESCAKQCEDQLWRPFPEQQAPGLLGGYSPNQPASSQNYLTNTLQNGKAFTPLVTRYM
ncbi:fungal-specific transcription factor domain-containing protein [Dichotomocladium elegans]|nr:fungal-specific transcription factor domain-containing protein [Dichotomocladium elegans]